MYIYCRILIICNYLSNKPHLGKINVLIKYQIQIFYLKQEYKNKLFFLFLFNFVNI